MCLLLWTVGCGVSTTRSQDAGPVSEDGAVTDAAVDAGGMFDGAVFWDAGGPLRDSGVLDAGAADASEPVDSGPQECEACTATECENAVCIDGVCERSPRPRGTDCGDIVAGLPGGVCLAGACTPRGCGDGYREPGPLPSDPPGSVPPAEECDDGNTLDGDACSAACENVTFTFVDDPDPESEYRLEQNEYSQETPIGVDGSGRVLIAYLRLRTGDSSLYVQRFTSTGVRFGEPMEIEAGISDAGIVNADVLGLPGGGWVLSYRSSTLFRYVFRIIAPSGAPGPVRSAAPDGMSATAVPRYAAVADGFVAVFAGRHASGARQFLARRFGSDGIPVATEPREVWRREPFSEVGNYTVAADGDDWVVLFSLSGSARGTYVRRYSSDSPLDPGVEPIPRPRLADDQLFLFVPRAAMMGGTVYWSQTASVSTGALRTMDFETLEFADGPDLSGGVPMPFPQLLPVRSEGTVVVSSDGGQLHAWGMSEDVAARVLAMTAWESRSVLRLSLAVHDPVDGELVIWAVANSVDEDAPLALRRF